MSNENERLLLEKQAGAYLVLGEKVHITFKTGYWKRGIIKEVNSDFLILDESFEGKIPIFFQHINGIEKYRSKKEAENGKKE